MTDEIMIPLRVSNPLNGSHRHWSVEAKKRANERRATRLVLSQFKPPELPAVVTLVRVAPRAMDSDGVRPALKSVRDEVAIWLGLPCNAKGHAEDNDARVWWRYQQGSAGRGVYAVAVHVERQTQAEVDAMRSREEWRGVKEAI